MTNNKYTVQYSKHGRYAIIEIFKNGQSFWEDLPGAKKNFRFGKKKALRIAKCLPTIRVFYESQGLQPEDKMEIIYGNDIIKKYSCFIRNDIEINRPYLEIRNNNNPLNNICFGLTKAEAIFRLRTTISIFAK